LEAIASLEQDSGPLPLPAQPAQDHEVARILFPLAEIRVRTKIWDDVIA
jgi:hypothetical protein